MSEEPDPVHRMRYKGMLRSLVQRMGLIDTVSAYAIQRSQMNKLADENIWIRGFHHLHQTEAIQKANITHVLSVLRIGLKESLFAPFTHYCIQVDDVDDEDLLQHFPKTYEFIQDGLAKGGAVYVHCAMGISRSATVLAAYLMKSRRISVDAALQLIRNVRPIVQPNLGFLQQLALYEEMEWPDTVEDNPKYQRWLFKQQVELSNATGRAPDQIRFCDQEQDVAEIEGLTENSSETVELELRCKRCRYTLATSHTLAPHTARKVADINGNVTPCAHHFLEPLLWMKPELSKGTISGKLECPKCKSKIGSYAWQGLKCSCGNWVVPGISVARGKVDEVKVARL